ncbi:MAG: DUF4337 domain-containing protein [Bdellovibrionales bacterium]
METEKRFEIRCGITLAFFAAILAVTDLFGGKFGDDELKMTNEKASAYMWYQSKSIKETIVEGQRDLLQSLLAAGAVAPQHEAALGNQVLNLSGDILKYKKEKQEILLGSAKVGADNWAQEINGQKGQVIGALEWGETSEQLARAGDQLDISALFLQLCLVMGAVSLVLQSRGSQRFFYALMVALGAIGTGFTIYGFSLV